MPLVKDLQQTIKDLSSAQEVDSQTFLSEISEKRAKVDSVTRQTSLRTQDDGRVVVSKRARPGLLSTSFSDEGITLKSHEGDSGEVISAEKLQEMAEASGLPWREDYAQRVIPIFSSDERVDRAGDIVMQDFVLDDYNRNPLVLFSHMWEGLPIGHSLEHKVVDRKELDYEGPALRQLMLFATEDQSPFADSVFRLMQAKLLRTVSIGFYPQKVLQVDGDEERKELGLGRWGVIMMQNDLIEVSPTSVPANPGALDATIRGLGQKSLLKPTDANVVREMLRIEVCRGNNDSQAWRVLDQTLRSGFKAIFPTVSYKEHMALDEPIDVTEVLGLPEKDENTIQKMFEILSKKLDDGLSDLHTELDDLRQEVDESEASAATKALKVKESQELDRALQETLELSDEALDSVSRVTGTPAA